MEITGSSISIPRNFLFLHKLPARFEMLVIARGAAFKESTAYEVELLGQRLVLRSKVELKPGTKYELEKENALVFRIVKEKHSENDNISDRHIASETIKEAYSDFENLSFQSFYGMTNLDLLSLKAIEEEGYSVKAQANKYIFDFGNEFSLQGVFVPLSAGEYALFVTGTSAEAVNLKELSENLLPLGIRKVERVSHASFEQISAGAIDMSI